MAWQGKVRNTQRNQNRLDIIIVYSNGEQELTETTSVTTAQEADFIPNTIKQRITQLNGLDAYEQDVIDSAVKDSVFTVDPDTGEVIDTPKVK